MQYGTPRLSYIAYRKSINSKTYGTSCTTRVQRHQYIDRNTYVLIHEYLSFSGASGSRFYSDNFKKTKSKKKKKEKNKQNKLSSGSDNDEPFVSESSSNSQSKNMKENFWYF